MYEVVVVLLVEWNNESNILRCNVDERASKYTEKLVDVTRRTRTTWLMKNNDLTNEYTIYTEEKREKV
jgi:hypothetical protein